MVFSETERYRLDPLAGDIWGARSTQTADFPTVLNVLRVPRAVNAHALIFPSRHTAPRCKFSFLGNISLPPRTHMMCEVVETEAPKTLEHAPFDDIPEVQEY